MLILSRYPDQELRIGDDITIRIVEVKGHQVRIGIVAPRNVLVLRGELYDRRQGPEPQGGNH